jgi:putative Holliday junction resolvase
MNINGVSETFKTPDIIALDYGRRRVGVAGCKSGVSIAFGITTLEIKDIRELVDKLQPILEQRTVEEIVMGFPMTLEDKPGTLKLEILKVRELLRERGYKVHLVDEALSSRQAAELLQKRARRAQKQDVDRTAAALILQEYLDGHLPPLSEAEINISDL